MVARMVDWRATGTRALIWSSTMAMIVVAIEPPSIIAEIPNNRSRVVKARM